MQYEVKVNKAALSKALAARKNGTATWNARGEYGAHQITLGVVADYAAAVYQEHRADKTQLRIMAVNEYDAIVAWHLDRCLYHGQNHCEKYNEDELVDFVARAWKYGIRGAISGYGDKDPYRFHVLNLYHKYCQE